MSLRRASARAKTDEEFALDFTPTHQVKITCRPQDDKDCELLERVFKMVPGTLLNRGTESHWRNSQCPTCLALIQYRGGEPIGIEPATVSLDGRPHACLCPGGQRLRKILPSLTVEEYRRIGDDHLASGDVRLHQRMA